MNPFFICILYNIYSEEASSIVHQQNSLYAKHERMFDIKGEARNYYVIHFGSISAYGQYNESTISIVDGFSTVVRLGGPC